MQKKFSVSVQDDELASIEIEGVIYHSVDEIPDEDDRNYAEFLIEDAKDAKNWEFNKEKFLGEVKPSKMPQIMFLLFLSIAILLLVISALSTVNAIRTMGNEQSLPGRVVSMVERVSVDPYLAATKTADRNRRSSDANIYNVYYYPEVEIRFPDESTKRLQLAQGSWPPAYEVGEEVTVLYNTEHPRDSSIKTSDSFILKFLAAMITGFIGLAFIGASLLVRWISKPDRQEAQAAKASHD